MIDLLIDSLVQRMLVTMTTTGVDTTTFCPPLFSFHTDLKIEQQNELQTTPGELFVTVVMAISILAAQEALPRRQHYSTQHMKLHESDAALMKQKPVTLATVFGSSSNICRLIN